MNTLTKKRLLCMAISLTLFLGAGKVCAQHTRTIDNSIYSNLPFEMSRVVQPTFPNYEVSIVTFGAKDNGKTLNTKAINDAIKAVNAKGGGRVIVPEGLWLTGPIELLSNVDLHLQQNALVLFTDDFEAYPIINTSFEGLETRRCQSPIWARGAENIAITGQGVFDGAGDSWRPVKKEKLTANQWNKLVKSGGVTDAKASTSPIRTAIGVFDNVIVAPSSTAFSATFHAMDCSLSAPKIIPLFPFNKL